MNKTVQKRMRKFLLLFLFPVVVVSCGNSGQQQRRGPQSPQSYPVLTLHPRAIELTSSYPATLEGMQTVEIRPRVQGYITKMLVDEGDWVHKGQVMFELNSEEFEQEVRSARANVQAAKAAVSTAEDEVKRLQSLADQDIISDYRLQSAKNTLKSQKAALAQAEARLENAQVNLGYTKVKSPTDGIIGTIPYRIGSLVSSNIAKPLTVVSDISKVYAYFSMSERELLEMARSGSSEGSDRSLQERVAAMPPVDLILADSSEYAHQGSLKLASGLINSETGSASFRAVFPNPNQVLRSGGSALIRIPYRMDSTIVIPKKSTFEIQNKRFVYAVTDSNTVESRVVSVLPLSTKRLFVVKAGLSENDRIVISGTGKLRDKTGIKPHEVNSDSLYQALTVKDQMAN